MVPRGGNARIVLTRLSSITSGAERHPKHPAWNWRFTGVINSLYDRRNRNRVWEFISLRILTGTNLMQIGFFPVLAASSWTGWRAAKRIGWTIGPETRRQPPNSQSRARNGIRALQEPKMLCIFRPLCKRSSPRKIKKRAGLLLFIQIISIKYTHVLNMYAKPCV